MKNLCPETNADGQYYSGEHDAGDSGAGAKTINWQDGNCQRVRMTGNCTFDFSNLKPGARYLLRLVEDATGGRAPTWPAAVKWPGGAAPALSGPNKTDLVAFYCDGTNLYGSASLDY